MNKSQQDLAWTCLPKEVRNHILGDYEYYLNRYEAVKANTSKGAIDALEEIFGHHNLTSDIEPPEMMMVEKSKVTELERVALGLLDSDIEKPNDVILRLSRGIRFTLKILFGGQKRKEGH